MKISSDQLATHLRNSLRNVYLISGDEELIIQEQCAAICAAAKAQQFNERVRLTADRHFDWDELLVCADNFSLFSDKTFIELHLPTGKPGDKGSKALIAYCEQPPEDKLLLIISSKLDAATQKSKWFKAIDAVGVTLAVWPIEKSQLPQWLSQRFTQLGMKVERAGIELLANRVEGNLLAAKQEIEKLHLLYGDSSITAQHVADSVASSARYDIFKLIDCALNQESSRVVKMMQGLQLEGEQPSIVLWALTRELRTLSQLQAAIARGDNMRNALTSAGIWEKRQAFFAQALQKLASSHIEKLLTHAKKIDEMLKGVSSGDVWDALMRVYLSVAGVKI